MLWSSYGPRDCGRCQTPGFEARPRPWLWTCPDCGCRWLRGHWPRWIVRATTRRLAPVPVRESPTAPPATADRWGSRGAETPTAAVPDPTEEDADDVG